MEVKSVSHTPLPAAAKKARGVKPKLRITASDSRSSRESCHRNTTTHAMMSAQVMIGVRVVGFSSEIGIMKHAWRRHHPAVNTKTRNENSEFAERNRELGVAELAVIDAGHMVAPTLQPRSLLVKACALRGFDCAGEMGARLFVAASRTPQPRFVHGLVRRFRQSFEA